MEPVAAPTTVKSPASLDRHLVHDALHPYRPKWRDECGAQWRCNPNLPLSKEANNRIKQIERVLNRQSPSFIGCESVVFPIDRNISCASVNEKVP
jgi:hypothetical protein